MPTNTTCLYSGRNARVHIAGGLRVLLLSLAVAATGMMPCQTWAQDRPQASDQPGTTNAERGNRVLRHGVFLKFKADSSAEQIQRVVDAFCALPQKIDSIKDFEWGTNNSPEGLDGGFTHCFLLTFADEQGRAAYLPHPAHKAFGELLGPHLDDVFVVDYWGQQTDLPLERALRHAVFFQFKPSARRATVAAMERAFAELPAKIDAVAGFEWGVNNSPENHADGFTHCFLVTFPSLEARSTYLPHPAHQAFVQKLKPVLEKVRVLDYWAQPAQIKQ